MAISRVRDHMLVTSHLAHLTRFVATSAPTSVLKTWNRSVHASIVPTDPGNPLVNSVTAQSGPPLIDQLKQIKKEYAAAGVTHWRIWVPGHLADVPAALAEAGYVPAGRFNVLKLDLKNWQAPTRPDLAIHGSPRSLAAAHARAHDHPAWRHTFTTTPPLLNVRYYQATYHDQVATTVVGIEHETAKRHDLALSFDLAFPPAYENGLWRDLMRAAIRNGIDDGCRSATIIVPTGHAARYIDQLGFKHLSTAETFILKRPETKRIRTIDHPQSA